MTTVRGPVLVTHYTRIYLLFLKHEELALCPFVYDTAFERVELCV